ncbi:MAG: DoxX family protein [Sphingobacterium sp.]|jgi:putative oxidoreductase|nr:DoxX family protein [Sphingobacterium sp.]
MKQKFFSTHNDYTGLIIRLTIGIVMFAHGARGMLGWFGGFGFTQTLEGLQQMGHPWLVGLLVILIEFFAPIFIIIGLASRLWAIAMGGLFIGIILLAGHLEHGFFMNWFGDKEGEGFEYHLLMLGLCLALFIQGSGKYSLDNLISKKLTASI